MGKAIFKGFDWEKKGLGKEGAIGKKRNLKKGRMKRGKRSV
jgi:hypothetical protein